MTEPVKHAPQTRGTRPVCAQQEAPAAPAAFTSFMTLSPDPGVFLGMDCVERPERLERSGHTAFIDNNTLFVWGGYQVSAPHLRRCALLARQLPATVCPLTLYDYCPTYTKDLTASTLVPCCAALF